MVDGEPLHIAVSYQIVEHLAFSPSILICSCHGSDLKSRIGRLAHYKCILLSLKLWNIFIDACDMYIDGGGAAKA